MINLILLMFCFTRGRLAADQEERFNNTSCDNNPDYRKQQDQKSSISINDAQITSYGCNYSNSVASNIDHYVKQEMKEQSINQQQQKLYNTQAATNHKGHDHPWSSCFSGENNHVNYLDFSRDRKRNQHDVLDQNTSLQVHVSLS